MVILSATEKLHDAMVFAAASRPFRAANGLRIGFSLKAMTRHLLEKTSRRSPARLLRRKDQAVVRVSSLVRILSIVGLMSALAPGT